VNQATSVAVDLAPADRAGLEKIVRRREAAWNASDGSAFARRSRPMPTSSMSGGSTSAGGTRSLLGTRGSSGPIYAGSKNDYTVEGARLLRPDVALVHVYAMLDVPRGPLAGSHRARFSLVLTKERGGWKIAALHNRLEAAAGPPKTS
jgi:uncharacterized protein (TIGR02246 family)